MLSKFETQMLDLQETADLSSQTAQEVMQDIKKKNNNSQQNFLFGENKTNIENLFKLAQKITNQWDFDIQWRLRLTQDYLVAKRQHNIDAMHEIETEIAFFEKHRQAMTNFAKEALLIKELDLKEQTTSLKDKIAEIILDLDIPQQTFALLLQRVENL